VDFTSLFEQYRILQLSFRFNPTFQGNAGQLFTAIDYDDNSTPVGQAELIQKESCQVNQAAEYFERVLNPRASIAAYSGSTFTASAIAPANLWFDEASTSIPFYGLKAYLPNTVTSGNIFNVTCEAVIQCRYLK